MRPSVPARPRTAAVLVVLGALSLLSSVGVPAPAGAATAAADDPPSSRYRPPVDGPITDRFRPPPHPYGPGGNRGVDFTTAAGTPVRAANAGEVEFAGRVGFDLHVVIRHDDGIRTSYSFLASVGVRRGQRVTAGDVIGATHESLHFGARVGDLYIDPERLFDGTAFTIRLVPSLGITESSRLAHRRVVEMLRDARDGNPVLDALGDAAGFAVDHLPDLAGWVADAAVRRALAPVVLATQIPELVGLTLVVVDTYSPLARAARLAGAVRGWYRQRERCETSPPRRGTAPSGLDDHVVVLVAGFGSSSEPGNGVDHLDTDALGVRVENVVRFSYAGGRAPDHTGNGRFAAIPATAYDHDDSQQSLETSARHLAALLADLAALAPGAPLDVVAHSQGGVVAVRAVELLAADGALPPDLTVVTIASPHAGSTAATAFHLVSLGGRAELGLDLVEELVPLGGHQHDSPAARDLSRASGFDADVPAGVAVTSIAARWDPVVPVRDTRLAGADHVVVDTGIGLDEHEQAMRDGAVTDAIGRALRHERPGCRGLLASLTDHAVSELVAEGQVSAAMGTLLVVDRPFAADAPRPRG